MALLLHETSNVPFVSVYTYLNKLYSYYGWVVHICIQASFVSVCNIFPSWAVLPVSGKCFSGKGKLNMNGLKITCTCAKLLLLMLQVLMDKKKALGPLCNCLLILLFAHTSISLLLYSLLDVSLISLYQTYPSVLQIFLSSLLSVH